MAFLTGLQTANDWLRDLRPLTRPSFSEYFGEVAEYVILEKASPEADHLLRERKLSSLARTEVGEYLVPGAGDGCPTVWHHYCTESPWRCDTPSVA